MVEIPPNVTTNFRFKLTTVFRGKLTTKIELRGIEIRLTERLI
jgi:hypothetical protein